MKSLANCNYLITGASRGIGKAIALKLAEHGANIIVTGKSVQEDPRLGGTIYSAAEEIKSLGVEALAVPCDIRNEEEIIQLQNAIENHFGVLHGVINNASAISLTSTIQTTSKRFDLMHDINVRGTFLVTAHMIPLMTKANGAHILTLSPPVDLAIHHMAPHIAYTLAKYNMSMMTMAWSKELEENKIQATALWPATTIATAAVKNLLGGDALIQRSRTTQIVADAAYYILSDEGKKYNGQCVLDETVLTHQGITDWSAYAVNANEPLQKDLFL